MRLGLPRLYSTVTCDLPSGPNQGSVPDLRSSARRLTQFVGQIDRQGHQRIGFIAGKAEHHALVAGADRFDLILFTVHRIRFEFLGPVHSQGDVGRLRSDGDLDAAGFAIEPFGAVIETISLTTARTSSS